jgi:hypothetical protein
MALILCHQCLSWVEPLGRQCPQCDFPLDARLPDPSPDKLSAVMGQLVRCIGDVRIARAPLPECGSLYETTHGLFFVPHRLERVRLIRGGAPQRTWRAMLRSFGRRAFRRSEVHRPAMRMEVAVDSHQPLGPCDSGELPNLLMQNPGVFFLSWRSIQMVRRSFWGWTILRSNSLHLRLKPVGDHAGFHERMAELAAGVQEACIHDPGRGILGAGR